MLSLQLMAVPVQTPALQVSPVVQTLPSLQAFVLFTCTHPVAGLQESVVQGLPSSQFSASPTQAPPTQASFSVHAFASLQPAGLPAVVAVSVEVLFARDLIRRSRRRPWPRSRSGSRPARTGWR